MQCCDRNGVLHDCRHNALLSSLSSCRGGRLSAQLKAYRRDRERTRPPVAPSALRLAHGYQPEGEDQPVVTTHAATAVAAISEHPEHVRTVDCFPRHGTMVDEELNLRHVRKLLEQEPLDSAWTRGELGPNRAGSRRQ